MENNFHLTPQGNVKKCTAVEACPYGGEINHFTTVDEAYSEFENRQKSSEIPKDSLKKLRSHALARHLIRESNMNAAQAKLLRESIILAGQLHENQHRKAKIIGIANTPYIEHPLRNALRLVRLGVREPSIIYATVLHDTVEDGSMKFVERFKYPKVDEVKAQQMLLQHIGDRFGSSTRLLVSAVTNPYMDEEKVQKLSKEQKDRMYLEHVQEQVGSSEEVFLVKVSDFLDNAGSLYYATDDEIPNAYKLSRKYLPCVEVFLESLDKHENRLLHTMSQDSLHVIREKLELIDERLSNFLAMEWSMENHNK